MTKDSRNCTLNPKPFNLHVLDKPASPSMKACVFHSFISFHVEGGKFKDTAYERTYHPSNMDENLTCFLKRKSNFA